MYDSVIELIDAIVKIYDGFVTYKRNNQNSNHHVLKITQLSIFTKLLIQFLLGLALIVVTYGKPELYLFMVVSHLVFAFVLINRAKFNIKRALAFALLYTSSFSMGGLLAIFLRVGH